MLTSAPRYLFFALYAAAALVLLDQLAEVLVSLYPFKPLELNWRFAAFGIVIGRTTTGVIADVLMILGALGLSHRRMLRTWGTLHLVAGALLLIGLAMFVLDTLEFRMSVAPPGRTPLVLTAVRAMVIVLLAVIYCVWVAIASVRAGRRGPASARDDDESLLVTGT